MSTKTSHRRKHAISFKDCKRLTESQHKDKCDIRRIVKSASRQGFVDHLNRNAATAGDLSSIPDFKVAMDKIAAAKSAFYELPSAIRAKFHNDPRYYVEFCSNADNLPELRRLGLALEPAKPEPEKIQKVEVVNTPADSGKA